MTIAFVLSGGGSRGDFQLGAILALRERGIRPDIICSTSVGSLNALMLAQGDAGADELARIWFGLRRNDHMWLFEDWWAEVHPSLREMIVQVVNGTTAAPSSSEPWAVHSSLMFGASIGTIAFGPAGFLAGALAGAAVSGTIMNITADAMKDAFRLIGTRARALMNIKPIIRLFATHFQKARFDAWVAGGGRLRLATVGLNSGQLAYVTEAGNVVTRSGKQIGTGVSVMDGALASASIAAVFPPVSFAGDHWVDGGHRECIPLQAALDLGADEIYVISAGPVDRESAVNRSMETPQPPDGHRTFPEDYEQARVLAIAPRALLNIHLDEMSGDDLYGVMTANPAVAARVKVIAPTFPTHDITTIDPELVRANSDYGYRVARDVLDGTPAALREDSDQIALAAGKVGRDRSMVLHSIGMPWTARMAGLRGLIAAARARRAAAGRPDGLGLRDALPVGSDMTPGDRLLPGQAITSPNGHLRLIYQTDGNLVLYDDGARRGTVALWANDRMGSSLGCVVMQRDGNLVCYDDAERPLWASNTQGNNDSVLRLQDDGRLVIYSADRAVWTQGRAPIPIPPAPVRTLTVRNAAPQLVHVAIYKVDDTVHAAALPDGAFDLTAGSERSWSFPSDVNQANVLVNNRHSYVGLAGATVVHTADDRVQLANMRPNPVSVRLFNANDIVRIAALPQGEISLPENGNAFFDMPSDIEVIAVMVGGHEVTQARRGERVEIRFDSKLYVRNDWDRTVKLTFYKATDTLRVFTLPGGALSVAAGQTVAFPVPSDVPRVQVSGNGRQAVVGAGDTLTIAGGIFQLVV